MAQNLIYITIMSNHDSKKTDSYIHYVGHDRNMAIAEGEKVVDHEWNVYGFAVYEFVDGVAGSKKLIHAV